MQPPASWLATTSLLAVRSPNRRDQDIDADWREGIAPASSIYFDGRTFAVYRVDPSMTLARYLSLLGALFLCSATASANGLTTGEQQGTTEYSAVERGFAQPGSALHEWMKSRARGVSDDIGFRYEIESQTPLESPGTLIESLTAPSTRSKNMDLNDSPGPPIESPNGIGSAASTSDSCGRLTIDGQPATGNVTFSWSFQNTRDSNGDRKKDFDPKWVLTGFSATKIELLTANGAVTC